MPEGMDIASHKIMSMGPEKRDRVINAALEEFCKGFAHASTDTIVRKAGISKGLLFHYFGTKEGLYEFLLWYAFDVMVKEYFGLLNLEQRDILDRLRQMILLKWDPSYKAPALFDFLIAAYARERGDPSNQFAGMYQAVQTDVAGRLFADIDFSLFRNDISADMAVSVIQWSLLGYSDSKISKDKVLGDYQKEYETYLADLDGYFSLFRKVFYP